MFGVVLLTSLLASSELADEIPVVGRPADLPFSGASAGFVRHAEGEARIAFQLETRVSPTQIEVEMPVTLTVTVRAVGPIRTPPQRINLRQIPAFSRSFHIEDVADGISLPKSSNTWRWSWRLKPRRAGVREVPGVPFIYYNPDLRPVEKAFQTIRTEPISIVVIPPERLLTTENRPAIVLELASGPGVWATQHPWQQPGPTTLTIVLLGPPLGCIVWFLAWRRLFPDPVRQAQQRRSWAARRALRALDRVHPSPGRQQADQVAGLVATYLRDRLDLRAMEPTPVEAAKILSHKGFPEPLILQIQELLRACDADRFGPDSSREGLPTIARTFITLVEEHACPPGS